MKIIFKATIFIFLISGGVNTIFPQNVSLGIGLNLPTGGGSQTMGFGLHLMNEYNFLEQYSARLNASVSLSELKGSPYMATDSYSFEEFEAAFLYYFMKGNFRPYSGIGAGYYIMNTSSSSNANWNSETNEYVSGNDIENNWGMNFIAGMKFNSLGFFSFGLEMKYNYLKSNWNAYIIGLRNYNKDIGKIDLSQLVFNANFIFNL